MKVKFGSEDIIDLLGTLPCGLCNHKPNSTFMEFIIKNISETFTLTVDRAVSLNDKVAVKKYDLFEPFNHPCFEFSRDPLVDTPTGSGAEDLEACLIRFDRGSANLWTVKVTDEEIIETAREIDKSRPWEAATIEHLLAYDDISIIKATQARDGVTALGQYLSCEKYSHARWYPYLSDILVYPHSTGGWCPDHVPQKEGRCVRTFNTDNRYVPSGWAICNETILKSPFLFVRRK